MHWRRTIPASNLKQNERLEKRSGSDASVAEQLAAMTAPIEALLIDPDTQLTENWNAFIAPTQYRLRVDFQPIFENSRVDTTEVDLKLEVSVI